MYQVDYHREYLHYRYIWYRRAAIIIYMWSYRHMLTSFLCDDTTLCIVTRYQSYDVRKYEYE